MYHEPVSKSGDPDLTKFLLDGVEHVLVISHWAGALEAAGLTEAERRVAEQVLRGLSNHRIAQRRGVSQRTVANQVASLFRKLGVSSRAELAAMVPPLGAARARSAGSRRKEVTPRSRVRGR